MFWYFPGHSFAHEQTTHPYTKASELYPQVKEQSHSVSVYTAGSALFLLPALDQESAPLSFKWSKCLHFFWRVLHSLLWILSRRFCMTRIPMMSFLYPPPQWFLWHTFCIVPPRKNNRLVQLKVLFHLQFLALPEAMRDYYEQEVVAKVLDFVLLFVCIYNLPMWQSHLVSATGNLCLYLKYL